MRLALQTWPELQVVVHDPQWLVVLSGVHVPEQHP
jgi:hypothetical protein